MSHAPVPPVLASARFPEEILDVLRRLKGAGHQAFLVGGLVRDLLLDRQCGDYDVATSARAEQVQRLFKKVIPTGIQHGTVTVLTRSDKVEVTTFRGEGAYADGRRPDSVTFLDDVVDDLARRDFTINAMAFDPIDGDFVDPFGGATDLSAKQVRCVGTAHDRFSEDGLRPLRAVRFASVLGFEIEPETFAAIPATLSTFGKIALERVREEVTKTLLGPHPGRGVRLLHETGLAAPILPELLPENLARVQARLDACERGLELRHAALLWEVPPQAVGVAMERLRHPRTVIDTVVELIRLKDFGLSAYSDDPARRHALSRATRKLTPVLLDLATAQAVALEDPAAQARVRENRNEIARILASNPPLTAGELALNGQAVMAILGVPPGRVIGEALRYLLEAVLDAPERNTREVLEALLRAWNPSR